MLSAWKSALEDGRTELEPFFVSVKDSSAPLKDLAQSREFKEFVDGNEGVNVYEAERAEEMCYFIEGEVPDLESFHWKLWNDYGIDSKDTSNNMEWYNDILSVFWYWLPRLAQFIQEKNGVNFKCIDAQDWLAFPAGFLARERLEVPLVCRFHSGEYGRSLGNPNMKAAPIQIERAALQFADYIQGVSISESTFQITHLMPLKEKMDEEMKEKKGEKWYRYQKMRDEKINSFLLYEPESELILLKEMVGGMPNGIYLDDWKKVEEKDILEARKKLKEMMPQKKKFIFFIGRPSYRKGLDFLLQSLSKHRKFYDDTGLVIASSMKKGDYHRYLEKFDSLGISDDVEILDKWLETSEKLPLMCASEVIALPSVYEPFGIVALEGLAADYAAERKGRSGPVVVAGNTGGMDEIIRSGVNGFEVPIENFEIDPDLLHQALKKALDEETRGRVSKRGAERVQTKYFRWEEILENVLKIYGKAEENWSARKEYFSS